MESILNHQKVLSILPDRKPDSHKGDYGRILLLCGSRGYTGAAALAAMGALRTGAGLVYLGVPESIYAIEAVKLNEPIAFPLPDRDGKLGAAAIPELLQRMAAMDAVLIGPGIGQSEEVLEVTKAVVREAQCPVVLDADGINLMAAHKDILRERTGVTVLTPHPGEFARLGGSIRENRLERAREMALDLGCILVLKGHETLITDGVEVYRNPTGNPGMAVGGSGDVLSGMIVSLLGQKIPPLPAAAAAVWLHGKAGDLCAEHLGQYGMLPSDLLRFLPRLMK